MISILLSCTSNPTTTPKTQEIPVLIEEKQVDPILQTIQEEAMRSQEGMNMLISLCDDIGPRLAGSDAYHKAAEWGIQTMKEIGLENTIQQPIQVQYWNRGAESLTMNLPREEKLSMLGLGMSIGTPPQGITGEVIVMSSFEELETQDVQGKIVVYNVPFDGYGKTVSYRTGGPTKAAQKGAIAALVRSITSRSLYTPHTGATRYEEDAQIPAAAITIEDAERFARYQKRGIPVSVTLYMEAQFEENMPASNVLGEIVGSSRPDEVIAMGCHLDSWDVGQGAQDDGAGCAIVLDAARIIAKQEQKPNRTIRVVLFGNEENGLAGAKAYAQTYAQEHVAAIEADIGAGTPQYFRLSLPEGYSKKDNIVPLINEQMSHLNLEPIQEGYAGADINPLIEHGVLGFGLGMDSSEYWPIHHTYADTIDKIDIQKLQSNTAAMASMAWTLANMPEVSK